MTTCLWCGRRKGAYGPRDYCTFMCKVAHGEALARDEKYRTVQAAERLAADRAMHGFAAVDKHGRRVDPANISAEFPSKLLREDQDA